MTNPQCARLSAALRTLARDLRGPVRADILKETGAQLEPFVEKETRSTIGDTSMSRWTVAKPVEIVGTTMKNADGSITVQPVRYALGPASVLTYGRQAYAVGDRRNSGRYISKRTGLVTQKTRKVSRAAGAMSGKGMWTRAEQSMEEAAPAIFTKLVVDEIGSRFT